MLIRNKNNTTNKFLWIFFLILIPTWDEKNMEKSLNDLDRISLADRLRIRDEIKIHTDLSHYEDFFEKIDLDVYPFIVDWVHFPFKDTLLNFFHILPKKFGKRVQCSYFINFWKYFNLLSLFITPNYVFKKFDIMFCFNGTLNLINKNEYLINTYFVYYKIYGVYGALFDFLLFLRSLNKKYLYAYSYFINFYTNIFKNLFYRDFNDFFIIKQKVYQGSSWKETNKRFFLNFYSVDERDDNSYIQKNLFISYSSIKFVKALGFGKKINLVLPLKVMMIHHLRRMFIVSNIKDFFIFFKSYVRDFKNLFINLMYPINEIFLNPYENLSDQLICDIEVPDKNYSNIPLFMDKYKLFVQNLFNSDNFELKWKNFINDFSNSLHYTTKISTKSAIEKIFVRYYFNCKLIVISKKKMFPLKNKKVQSISRRRYKQIVKSAKRRFWLF